MKYNQAELFRDKVKMKNSFKNININLPTFIEIGWLDNSQPLQSYEKLKHLLGNKFVLKPKLDFGAHGVKIINNYNDFLLSVDEIKNFQDYEAETFINGDLYHVDSIHINGSAIFQVCCRYSFPTFEFQLGKPNLSIPIPENSNIAINASILIEQVLRALNYANGPSHLEFFVNENEELIFLEIAARTPGGFTTIMYDKMYDFNMLNADLYINLDLDVSKPKYSGKYVFRGIFPIKQGLVTKINIPNTLGVTNIHWEIEPGYNLDLCTSLRDVAAKIVVENNDYSSAFKDFEYLSEFNLFEVVK
jgi:biotin carboxylase